MKTIKLALLMFFSVAVASCGGGGGGGGGAAPLAKVEITPANEQSIAANALDSGMVVTDVGELGNSSSKPTTQTAAPNKRVLSRLTTSAVQKIMELRDAPASVTGAMHTYFCNGFDATNGTFSISSSGSTSARLTFTQCDFSGDGEIVNGTMSFSGMVETTDSVSARVSLNLSFSDGISTTTISGAFTFGISGMLAQTVTTTMSGTHLKFTEDAISKEIFDFSSISAYNTGTGFYTDDSDFTFSSSVINGSVTFETVTPFESSGIATYPNSGVMKITGANSTCLRVTVLGNESFVGNQIQFERSTDNCSTYSPATFTTWVLLYP